MRAIVAVLICMMSIGTANAQYNSYCNPKGACRPNGRDMAHRFVSDDTILKFIQDRQMSQTEMDLVVQMEMVYVFELMEYCQSIPACASSFPVSKFDGFVTEVETRFDCCKPYKDPCGCGCELSAAPACLDDWVVTLQAAATLYFRIRTAHTIMSNTSTMNDAAKRACAAYPLTDDQRDFLDHRVVTGTDGIKRCEWPAAFVISPKRPKVYASTGPGANQVGKIDARIKCPSKLDANDLALLEATDQVHHQQHLANCGQGPAPAPIFYAGLLRPAVHARHMMYEDFACKVGMTPEQCERERHCRHIDPFSGKWHKKVPVAQKCPISTRQHIAHERWDEAQKLGLWGCSVRRNGEHQFWHFVANFWSNFKGRLPCRGCTEKIADCYAYTGAQYLTKPLTP